MTREVAEKIVRGITDKIECNTVDIDDWAEYWGFTRDEYEEFLDMAIKALEAHERLTEMLNKKMTAYAETEKSKHLNDLEYGNKIAYAHCLEVLNDDE